MKEEVENRISNIQTGWHKNLEQSMLVFFGNADFHQKTHRKIIKSENHQRKIGFSSKENRKIIKTEIWP